MVLLLLSIAPSATIMIFSLFIPARFYREWVVERKHDRKTETLAVKWSLQKHGKPDDDGFLQSEWLLLQFGIWQHPAKSNLIHT